MSMAIHPLEPDTPEVIAARGRRQLVVLIGLAAALLLLGLRITLFFFPDLLGSMSRFECVLRSTTGVACPTCGGTRALVSLVRGDVWRALYWNPLIVVGALALPALGTMAVFAPEWFDQVAGWLGRWLRSWWGRCVLVAAVAAQVIHMTLH